MHLQYKCTVPSLRKYVDFVFLCSIWAVGNMSSTDLKKIRFSVDGEVYFSIILQTESSWKKTNFRKKFVETGTSEVYPYLTISFFLCFQWIGPDGKNSSWNVLQIDQAEFGMPTREYYLDSNQLYRLAYLGLMTSVAELLVLSESCVVTQNPKN